ncbi:unnamed protein product [Mytilus coruscus]|uniref:Uncharacterized protein n=1 Tax=Mytilus coruscus TaxID=42192 RepID=A0A6J8AM78_MYTCO|nr:unnamed protein product [Mytilus coruscus]
MADMHSVWLNLPRPTPLPFEITRNTTVEEMLGLSNILPVKITTTDQQNQPMISVAGTVKQSVLASETYHPVFSIICNPSYDSTERKSELLESRLHSYEISFPTEVDALFTEYYNITADIEMKRLTAVMESSPQYHCRINQLFNHQRQILMYRIDRKLSSLVKPATHHNQSTLNSKTSWYCETGSTDIATILTHQGNRLRKCRKFPTLRCKTSKFGLHVKEYASRQQP